MLLPIYAYGQPILKRKALPISKEYPDLSALIQNMWDTMYHASGVGLAAPQIGLGIRVFVVDTQQMMKDEDHSKGIKLVFINPEIVEESGKLWSYEEGCLSIPNIRGDVERLENIKIKFLDEDFIEHEADFGGINARVIQHEYDHLEGKLFIEKLSPLKKKLIQRKLENIKKGKVATEYRLKFAI